MPRNAPKLTTFHDIGREVFVEGTHGLTESKFKDLLKHPETARIFREHGVINVKNVLYGLRTGQKESVRSLEQGRKIFHALKATAGAPHAEEIRRSVTMGRKTDQQLLEEAQRREGGGADPNAHHEKMMKRARLDAKQANLYAQARANVRSSAASKSSMGEDDRGARTSVADGHHRASVFKKSDPKQQQAPATPPATKGGAVEIAGGTSSLATQSLEPRIANSEPPLSPPAPAEKPIIEETSDKPDVILPKQADDSGLPL
jgi:hypothetical protein